MGRSVNRPYGEAGAPRAAGGVSTVVPVGAVGSLKWQQRVAVADIAGPGGEEPSQPEDLRGGIDAQGPEGDVVTSPRRPGAMAANATGG